MQAGDLVVCVDVRVGDCTHKPVPFKLHQFCRVIAAWVHPYDGLGVAILGFRSPTSHGFWKADRFRKIDAPDTEIAQRIKACKPIRERVS